MQQFQERRIQEQRLFPDPALPTQELRREQVWGDIIACFLNNVAAEQFVLHEGENFEVNLAEAKNDYFPPIVSGVGTQCEAGFSREVQTDVTFSPALPLFTGFFDEASQLHSALVKAYSTRQLLPHASDASTCLPCDGGDGLVGNEQGEDDCSNDFCNVQSVSDSEPELTQELQAVAGCASELGDDNAPSEEPGSALADAECIKDDRNVQFDS